MLYYAVWWCQVWRWRCSAGDSQSQWSVWSEQVSFGGVNVQKIFKRLMCLSLWFRFRKYVIIVSIISTIALELLPTRCVMDVSGNPTSNECSFMIPSTALCTKSKSRGLVGSTSYPCRTRKNFSPWSSCNRATHITQRITWEQEFDRISEPPSFALETIF